MSTTSIGALGERIAALFLAIKGYEVLEKNFRYARREIDLVARDGDALVAVEVKLRRGRRYGTASEAIDARKLGRLEQALSGLMRSNAGLRPRIDVVAIDINENGTQMVVEHFAGIGRV